MSVSPKKLATGAVLTVILAAVFGLVLYGSSAWALNTGLEEAAQGAGLAGADSGSDVATIVGRVINSLLGLLGIVFMVLVIYAGYLWMMSEGNAAQIDRAKKIMVNAVIGLLVVFASWAIVLEVGDIVFSAVGL